jgi:branched-chain amino acid transport system ATP-binding protein
MLEVQQLEVRYGSLAAVQSLSLHVGQGEIVAMLGANGAGKSSTLKAIMGIVPVAAGSVRWDGHDITRQRPHQRVRQGITLCPEGRGILTSLSVRENLELGGYLYGRSREQAQRLEEMFTRFPRLAERSRQPAGTLSGGEQQMLAVARALMCRPRLLLLDEPSLGLAPMTAAEVMKVVREIGASGVSVLIVEQNVKHALQLAQRAYVMESGRLALAGEAQRLLNDPRVQDAYLGGGVHAQAQEGAA